MYPPGPWSGCRYDFLLSYTRERKEDEHEIDYVISMNISKDMGVTQLT